MIECPRCDAQIKGHVCECGYKPVPAHDEKNIQCRRCESAAVTTDEIGPICRKCFAEKPLNRPETLDYSDKGSRAWAYKIIDKQKNGEFVHASALEMARAVCGISA